MVCWKRAVLGMGAVVLACSSSGGDGGGGAGGKYASRRTPVCKTWQDAMCDFIADKCQAQARADCDELYQSLFCKDDATMQACVGVLGTATCSTPLDVPAQCKQINDAQPVGEFCQDFGREVCKLAVRCGEVTDQSTCEAEVASQITTTCNAAVGLAPTADQCLADLQSLACGSESPASCKGVIKTLEAPTSAALPWMKLSVAAPMLPLSPEALSVPEAR